MNGQIVYNIAILVSFAGVLLVAYSLITTNGWLMVIGGVVVLALELGLVAYFIYLKHHN